MIKLIATDMDGSFLTSQNTYDRETFRKLYAIMKEKNIKFVVASGNQYYQLKSFFEDYQDELTYVSENGAWVVEKTKELFSVHIPKDHVRRILNHLDHYKDIKLIVCGKENAYILEGDQAFYDESIIYYHHLKQVESFDGIENKDEILKFNFFCDDEKTQLYCDLIQEAVGDIIFPTCSGHGCVDLIIPGYHKGHAIEFLCNHYGITLDECMAFGDGGNDIEMLKRVGYSYAMANAKDHIKEICKYQTTKTNNEGGVIDVLKHYLLEE